MAIIDANSFLKGNNNSLVQPHIDEEGEGGFEKLIEESTLALMVMLRLGTALQTLIEQNRGGTTSEKAYQVLSKVKVEILKCKANLEAQQEAFKTQKAAQRESKRRTYTPS